MGGPTVSRNEKNGVLPKKRLMDVSDYPGHDLSGLSLFRTSPPRPGQHEVDLLPATLRVGQSLGPGAKRPFPLRTVLPSWPDRARRDASRRASCGKLRALDLRPGGLPQLWPR